MALRTYEDLLSVTTDADRMDFVKKSIGNYKSSEVYKDARIAYDYYRRRNVTITEYQKLLYTMSGEVVPDNFSANYKFTNAFFSIFVRQEASHLLGNGVTFEKDETKERLGGSAFDSQLMKAAKSALWGGVAYGFFNLDHIDVFSAMEFVPLFGEEDGALHAGIRFWQIDSTKPLRATLYEQDGYTEYIWDKNGDRILQPKRAYVNIIRSSVVDGVEIMEGKNYPNFPIVPLWGNLEHQTELTGLREKIDGYDLIQSGFADDLDEASQIYWIIQNGGGMDDVDLKKFLDRLKTVKAAVVEDGGAQAEAHTLDVPYAARTSALEILRDSLYRDAMALDTDKISAGNITATAIEASYENLTLKCDDFEMCVTDFIQALLDLLGIEDEVSYKRSKIVNMQEDTNVILASAQYLDDETILKHLPFLSPDEIADIIKRKEEEERDRAQYVEDEEEEVENVGRSKEMDGQETEPNGGRNRGNVR